MIKLTDLQLDKNDDSNNIYLKLKEFIDNYCNQDHNQILIKKFSKILNISESAINLKFKRCLYNDFDPPLRKFKKNFKVIRLLKNFLLFTCITIFVKIFGKKKFKKKYYDLMIDEVDNLRQLNKFNKLLNKFDKVLISTKNKEVFKQCKNRKIDVIKNNRILPSKNYLENNFFNLIFFFFKILKLSMKAKENYFDIYFIILLSLIKNESFFYQVYPKIILQDRFYINCSIKNFVFKKNGGKKTICCQYHIAESGICFYADFDILFSFGEEQNSIKKLKTFGSNVEKSIPVGSLQMESEYYNFKEYKQNLEDTDLLIIGINPSHAMQISKKVFDSYYIFLNWIVKFESLNPHIRITYKHHTNYKGDKIENEIFKNSKIKILKAGNTYQYLKKCKFVISNCSSMILEALSIEKNCFYVDPNNSLSTYFSYHEFDKNLILDNYNDFNQKMLSSMKNGSQNKVNQDRICLNSKNVSENIYKNIKDLLEKF